MIVRFPDASAHARRENLGFEEGSSADTRLSIPFDVLRVFTFAYTAIQDAFQRRL